MRVFQRFESSIFRKTNIRRGFQNADKTIKTDQEMTKEQLEKVNSLKDEIDSIESFLRVHKKMER